MSSHTTDKRSEEGVVEQRLVRPDYVKCIQHTHANRKGESWCRKSTVMEWAFQDIDHATYAVQQEYRFQPCPECVDAISRILWPNDMSTSIRVRN